MYRVIKYINQNLHRSISAEETAEHFGYSKWYFCQSFKKYTGQTFVEYVRRNKMQYAAIDILNGKKVLDVALDYGYDTQSGFNKAFIKQYGCYPVDYRKNVKAAQTYYKEKMSMLMLTDRCAMLRDKALSRDMDHTRKIALERTYHYAKGCLQEGKTTISEIYGAGLANVLLNSTPIITEGELLVGYNYGDHGYEGFVPFSNEEETLKITSAMNLSDEEVEWFRENAGSYLRNCDLDTSYYAREGKEWALSMEMAAVGRCVSFNHSVIGYREVVKYGFEGLLERVRRYKEINGDTPFYRGIEKVCLAAMQFGDRYADEAERLAQETTDESWANDLKKVAAVCRRVPKYPARTFHEAAQSLLFAHIFNTWEDGINANSLGRLDQILYPYYKNDIEKGILTKEEAFELICCLWIKLYRDYDVQQSCVGGVKSDGTDAVNELSYMMLDATESLGFVRCLSVRYSPNTDRAFLRRALEVVGHVQKGVPFFFNDDVLIPALVRRGISLEDARDYTQIGCVETVIPGKSNPHAVSGITNLLKALEYVFNHGYSIMHPDWLCGSDFGDPAKFDYKALKENVFAQMDEMLDATCHMLTMDMKPPRTNDFKPIKSLLTQGCLESGHDFNDEGATYDYYQMMLCGIPNLADSLMAIKKLVFDEKRYTLAQVIDAVENNYPDEAMRQDFLNKAPKFGNDIPEVDELAAEIMDFCCDRLEFYSEKYGHPFHPQPFTFIDMIFHGMNTAASPDGRKAGEPIAYSVSPMQGRDFNGFTALINSLCALPTVKAPGSTSAIVEVNPKLFTDANLDYFVDIMLTAAQNGLCNVQFNTVDADTLIDAQKHPEKYNNLAVRVSGFSQKFNLLEKELQNHIIGRTKHAAL